MPLIARLDTLQTQQQTLSLQQRYALKLLQMNAVELRAEADAAAAENPFLELEDALSPEPEAEDVHNEAEPLEAMYSSWADRSYSADEGSPLEQIASPATLRSDLKAELRSLKLPERDRLLVACLIEELDDDGLLRTPLETVAREYSAFAQAPLEEWERALATLKTFDPPGVGASSPTEALALEALRLGDENESLRPAAELLAQILRTKLDALAKRSESDLLALAGGKRQLLSESLALLSRLNPHPASTYGEITSSYVRPDILIVKQSERWVAMIHPAAQPNVRLVDSARQLSVQGSTPFANYLREARQLVGSIAARQETLLRTAQAVVARQQAVFAEGWGALRPCTMAEVAAELQFSESTVSRAVSGKYCLGPGEVFELRRLFTTGGVSTVDEAGREVLAASTQIRARIAQLIAQEPSARPLSDQAIADILRAEGTAITRRTVAKYRDLEGIPSTRIRAARSRATSSS